MKYFQKSTSEGFLATGSPLATGRLLATEVLGGLLTTHDLFLSEQELLEVFSH